MMEEAARIGAALGMQASTPVSTSIEKMIGKIRALGAFKMSMLQDMERDNPVELDALLTVTHDFGSQEVGIKIHGAHHNLRYPQQDIYLTAI